MFLPRVVVTRRLAQASRCGEHRLYPFIVERLVERSRTSTAAAPGALREAA
ncbi:protein of unknown function [Pararobbsia alpina]